MYLGEQLHNPTDARLTLSAQLGVGHVAWRWGGNSTTRATPADGISAR